MPFSASSNGGLYGVFQTEQVIARVLPGEMMVACVEQDPSFPGGIIHDAAADFATGGGVHDQRANLVGAVIDS